jgi:Baseplate J-like protein
MPLPLPNLDDRRWRDLTQEAIPLIPRYAPQWTDFNTHDPGITLMEMLAWLTESMVYQLNQVPTRFTWKFLSFIGYSKRGPVPAHTVLTFDSLPPGAPFEAPQGVEFAAAAAGGELAPFATTRAINLAQVKMTALQVDPGTGILRDYSGDFADDLPIAALGADPQPGAALYLGFETIPTASPVALWFWFQGSGHGPADRERIIEEAAAQQEACKPLRPGWRCGAAVTPQPKACDFASGPTPPHHSAVIVWEAFAAGAWIALDAVEMPSRPAPGQVMDDTRSLTLDGLVELNLPGAITQTAIGPVKTPLYYVRARLASGAYDAPVVLTSVRPNAVSAAQRAPLWQQLTFPDTTPLLAAPPVPGAQISLQFTLAPDLSVLAMSTQSPPAPGQPAFTFLNYVAPLAGAAGSVTLQFAIAGLGTAVPSQQVYVSGAPVVNQCLTVYTHDGFSWTTWKQVEDFDAARRTDLVYTLDPATGLITCGDGEQGQVFPQSSAIVVTGFATLGERGNIFANRPIRILSTPINAVLLGSLSPAQQALLAEAATDPVAAAGGLPSAPVTALEGAAAAVVAAHERILDLALNAQQTTLDQIPKSQVLALPAPSQAVNLLDTERIALDVPGTFVARARAWPDTSPAFPGLHATGVVTVTILPEMPVAQPQPSAGLLNAVKRYLDRRRIICTRIELAGPTYVVITVTASVQALTGANANVVQNAILAALQGFLNPLTGGPAGLGWPFGRSVYNAEILELIGNVQGVDYVNSLAMTANSGAPQCGDIALCPTFLVSSGNHQIQVGSA